MNSSKMIFRGNYIHLDNQAHGECDFADAKMPIDQRQGKLIGIRKGDIVG